MTATKLVETENSDGGKDDSYFLKHKYQDKSLEELQLLLKDETISKNQKKKIKKQINWLETADERKELRKKRKIEYKERNKLNGTKKRKLEKVSTNENFGANYHVAIDASFNDLMDNRDIKKLAKQIGWCYKENRRSVCPVQYHMCGLNGRLKGAMDPSHENWDLHFDADVLKQFEKDNLVYLTAESDNILSNIDRGKVYIIGGLVDHNHEKGLCQKLCVEKGIATARLPLGENINIKTRKVLTVNHVFEIILAFLELQDWKAAILKVLPPKKLPNQDGDKLTKAPGLLCETNQHHIEIKSEE
uniref:tRNA methyltransferase 10 homolog A n=1 Tax=Ciona savignyi TaxID=51511 RepID=H2ZFZ0_CIOSA